MTDPRWQAEADVMRGHVLVARERFHVFPVDHPMVPYCDGIKTPQHDPRACVERGKHPCVKWSRASTQDLAVLTQRNYFGSARPHNIGVDCGRSGLLVVDEDKRGAWDKACELAGIAAPPVTYTVATAKGRHLYFEQPADPMGNQAGSLHDLGIDVRGVGGYVVGAGSLHASGARYTVEVEAPILATPDWLVKAVKVMSLDRRRRDSPTPATGGPWWRTGPIPQGRRHEAIVAAAGWARRMGLSEAEARPTVLDVQARCEGDEHTEQAALATLADVYGRYPAGDRLTRRRARQVTPPPIMAVPEDKPRGPFPDGHGDTDVDNAARLIYVAGGKLRYVHAWGKWLVYEGGRWVRDEGDVLVTERAKGVARMLFGMVAKCVDDDQRKRVVKAALKAETAGAIRAMVTLARGAPGILVKHEQLDADPYLLNCTNGTVDLRTGKLRRHNPEDLCTQQAPVAYDPAAKAPLWESCVERWQPDPAVRRYVQARAGAGATGIPTETVDVDYGSGGNGKSKFWGAVQHVLGEYAVIPHKSLLVTTYHEQHATVVADLFRRRLAVASETARADILNDEQVKSLTGGDRLSGRRMRENPWEFEPTHTLVMFSNHKPQVQGRDEGIWRRLRLVPWEVTIPEDERDDELADKLRAEAPGVLAWVVRGAHTFLQDGLTPPDSVRVATAAYRSSEDTIGRFIADTLTIGDGWVMSGDLARELEAWSTDQGVDPAPRMNELAEALRQLGVIDGGRRMVRGKRGTIWKGVTLTQVQTTLDVGPDQGERS